jgi:organic radical activating enzyme
MSINDFFCPAPWTGLYYHENTASPCHISVEKQSMTPTDYLQSDWLANIKRELKEGKVPKNCAVCWKKEQRGIKSSRQSEIRMMGNGNYGYGLGVNRQSSDFNAEDPTEIVRIELRSSNLCNYKCRMCNADSSSEWQKEVEEHPELLNFITWKFRDFTNTSEGNFDELKKLSLDNVKTVCFTGGEPLLIKQYYDFMDHMIENGYHKHVVLELFSNCSVWNPVFIDRLLQFKKARMVMSIDGVGKAAEYNRKGTVWKTQEENFFKYAKLPLWNLHYNIAISPYNLLDFANLAKFLMKIYDINPILQTRCYSVTQPYPLHWIHLNADLRTRVINEIDKSVEILHPSNFDVIKKELLAIKTHMLETRPEREDLFISFTQTLDTIRNEKFEDVYGYKLY